ncbi:MAG: class I SAM-dependent methyltransferase [Candidatus Woesearchaeota archaeon]|jgi:SAM-dependent methyltransferase|nr:class I SAM-dependent methyltransferase [Candidatus Woesearchaeota archaeon]MDP7198394.1 class I SAM-dependent methyltransferase [Candidatus Woesearchaeota archaeon]MDP7467496.1 class I SAM-dependent methyltransferase [Candidatus Woesearchaeota archaeon]MDP7647723.1 class I SAM-dependent methyltransferase [Candidatus Woesearchaeota archaeon]
MEATKKGWEKHWKRLDTPSAFSKFAQFFRLNFRARAVRQAFRKHFPATGTFVETGSGSSQTSYRIPREGKTLIAVDYAQRPLDIAKRFVDKTVKADIRKMPFKKDSIDGIWNLGVMEHFTAKERAVIFKEFRRVLKPGGRIVLFWPTPHASDRIVLSMVSSVYRFFGVAKTFFPDEPGRITPWQARAELQQNKFKPQAAYMPFWDCWTEMIVVGEK